MKYICIKTCHNGDNTIFTKGSTYTGQDNPAVSHWIDFKLPNGSWFTLETIPNKLWSIHQFMENEKI